jgi:energy-coupling factor transporter ATP-binding protein EcfA2
MSLIDVQDVWYSYGNEVMALKGVSLKIELKETVALIGQNGGGKTTLAKQFNGLLKPTRGRVLIKGVETREVATNRLALTVGYVFQNPSHQIFCSKVWDEVAFGPRNAGFGAQEIEDRTKWAIGAVGLSGYEQTHPYDLDYGKMKLLTIASIMSIKPEVYCLDEPTTGQDHQGRRRVAELIRDLNEVGSTVIVITHDMRFVAEVAKRIVLVAAGKIVADGPTREIFEETDTLAKAQIRPPQITQLAHALADCGVPRNLMTIREAADSIGAMIAEGRRWGSKLA